MKLIKEPFKLIFPLIASGTFSSTAIAGGEGSLGKPMQLFRFKTPQMVLYINSTISLLDSQENPNKRHINVLQKCQKILSSGKKLIRGMEIKTLKTCASYMNSGLYEIQKDNKKTPYIENLEKEIQTLKQVNKSNNENQNLNEREKNQIKRQKEIELKEKIIKKDSNLFFN